MWNAEALLWYADVGTVWQAASEGRMRTSERYGKLKLQAKDECGRWQAKDECRRWNAEAQIEGRSLQL